MRWFGWFRKKVEYVEEDVYVDEEEEDSPFDIHDYVHMESVHMASYKMMQDRVRIAQDQKRAQLLSYYEVIDRQQNPSTSLKESAARVKAAVDKIMADESYDPVKVTTHDWNYDMFCELK
jgi:hypothetical protein